MRTSRLCGMRERPINSFGLARADQGHPRAALDANDVRIRPLRAQHPVQSYRQLACRCHLSHRFRLLVTAMQILSTKLGIVTPRDLRRFHQQHAQHAVALLGDRPQLLPSARGVLARNQTQITGHLLAAREAADIAQGQHIGQRRDRTDSGLGLKKQRHFVSLSFGFDRLIQRFDLLVEHRHQLEQVVSPTSCPRLQRQLAQDLLSGLAPQLVLPLHSFIQAKVLQFVLHPRPHDHQLVTMQQQLPQVAHFTRWHPDPRKPPLDQQLQNMRRIALVRLLLPYVAGTNLRRIAHPQLVTQLAQQIHQPVTVAGGFHADQRRRRYSPVEPFRVARGLYQLLLPGLSRLRIQPTHLLPAGMKITSYNHHVRRLLSFREALVLKPRLPDSIEPSLLSNQAFRVLCERVGTFSRSRREFASRSFSAAHSSRAAKSFLFLPERLAREGRSDSTFRAMSHFPHFSSVGAEYSSPARERWV